ncbi:acylphosphatase [Patescibacteria group bacterium]|nr:acylphosphatase [Patescibacteria group bacterium]
MRAYILVSGYVQKVGYRYFVKREAEKLDLTGYASNLANGQVEILVEGESENVNKIVGKCKKGPFLANVRDFKMEIKEGNKECKDFKIIV